MINCVTEKKRNRMRKQHKRRNRPREKIYNQLGGEWKKLANYKIMFFLFVDRARNPVSVETTVLHENKYSFCR